VGDEAAYRAPAGTARAEVRDRGSRFLAIAGKVSSQDEVEAALAALRREFPDATHHCYAWRLGWPAAERAADAGEPGGTAGMPILQVLRGAGLSDALLVVVRWFGGTKLGKGGLARAYAAAAREALAGLPTAARVAREEIEVSVPLERVGAVKRLLRPPAIELLAEEYGERARLRLGVERPQLAALRERLAELGLAPAERDGSK